MLFRSLAMKAALASADGRSRSKGHPSGAGKKGGHKKIEGKSFARPTQMTSATTELLSTKQKIAAANDNKSKAESKQSKPAAAHPRRERFMKNYDAAKNRLGKVLANVKAKVAAVRDKALPKSNAAQLARNAEHRKSKAGATKTKTKDTVAKKPVAPPPPGPRRGK